jgi:hypothetical protein
MKYVIERARIERNTDVMLDKLESSIIHMMLNILLAPGYQVVNADHGITAI